MADVLGEIEVRDERTHQASLADAGSECEAKRREFALEVFDLWEFSLNGRQRRGGIAFLRQRNDVGHSRENLKRVTLGQTKRKALRERRSDGSFAFSTKRQFSDLHTIAGDTDQRAGIDRSHMCANDALDHARHLPMIQTLQPDADD